MANSVRSVLIGSESLLIQCGQVLKQAGHQIVAVVTTRAAIRRWAAEKGIRVLADSAALLAAQDIRPFDYLFSITNLSVLSPEVIAMPTRGQNPPESPSASAPSLVEPSVPRVASVPPISPDARARGAASAYCRRLS